MINLITRSGVISGVALTALHSVAAPVRTKQATGHQSSSLSCQVHPASRILLFRGQIPVVLKSMVLHLPVDCSGHCLISQLYLLKRKHRRTLFSWRAEISDITFLFRKDPQCPLKEENLVLPKTLRSLCWLLTSPFYRHMKNCE